MSTYQGERFVAQQLASILSQLPADGVVMVRDDGSTDGTVAAVEGLRDARVMLVRGANIGFVRSFLELMDKAPAQAEVIMLSDQDDVWLPHKIERACRQLEGRDARPTLYCSRLQLVDAALQPIGLSPHWPRGPSFHNALTENIVTGCTAAFNRAALELVRRHGDAGRIHFHDWWMYLMVSAFGDVIVDPQPSVLYRQHSGNAIGMGSGLGRYWAILKFLRRTNWVRIMYAQADNLMNTHGGALQPAQRAFIQKYLNPASPFSAARLVLAPRILRQSLLSELLFRLLVTATLALGWGRAGWRKRDV